MSAARELTAEVVVDAAPETVWEVLSDLSRMPGWSPELVRMVPLKKGGLRVGQWYLGLNRRKAVVWPTRSVVVTVEPGKALAWDTTSSGARWVFELTPEGSGTRVTQRRPMPNGPTFLSRTFAPLALGGSDEHADELESGMRTTLERFKKTVEGSVSATG